MEFSGDQQGSRFIQQKLETANSDEKDQVFREIKPNAIQLMKDVFGNYVIQKFFEHGSQVQKKVLAGIMKGQFADLAVQTYACRVVQKVRYIHPRRDFRERGSKHLLVRHPPPLLTNYVNIDLVQVLEHALVEQQVELIKELEPDVLKIVKDQHGNHVIQRIIQLVPREYTDFIMDCFRGRVHELSKHTYGCRVIQRVMEHGTDADKAMVMEEIHTCCQALITDQYGNYVTQHVIRRGRPDDQSKMKSLVIAELLTLSKHKFASNVVEKCIEFGTPEELRTIRTVLTTPDADGNDPLPSMIKDQYGNYVIRKLDAPLSPAMRLFIC